MEIAKQNDLDHFPQVAPIESQKMLNGGSNLYHAKAVLYPEDVYN